MDREILRLVTLSEIISIDFELNNQDIRNQKRTSCCISSSSIKVLPIQMAKTSNLCR